jgi:hypothetical protein
MVKNREYQRRATRQNLIAMTAFVARSPEKARTALAA